MIRRNPANGMDVKKLSQYPILNTLEMKFLATVNLAYVFCDGTVAVLITHKDDVYGIGSGEMSAYFGFNEAEANLPRKIDALCKKKIIDIVCGGSKKPFLILTTSDGDLYSLGHNGNGQLGDGDKTDRPKIPHHIQVERMVLWALQQTKRDLSITNGTSSKNDNINVVQVKVTENVKVIQVACGEKHTVALLEGGSIYTWGYNGYYELGNGSTTDDLQPQVLDIKENIKSVSCGVGDGSHTLAITDCGEIYSWGYNGYGQLGHGDAKTRTKPTLVTSIKDTAIVQACCGDHYTMILTHDGDIYTWGKNDKGQLGSGNRKDVLDPHLLQIYDENGQKVFIEYINAYYRAKLSVAQSFRGDIYVWGKCGHNALVTPFKTHFSSIQDAMDAYMGGTTWKPIKMSDSPINRKPLISCMLKGFNNSKTSDVTFFVKGEPIYVHKALMEIRLGSDYCKSLFGSDWDESSEITVENCRYEVYKAFLKYLYTDELNCRKISPSRF